MVTSIENETMGGLKERLTPFDSSRSNGGLGKDVGGRGRIRGGNFLGRIIDVPWSVIWDPGILASSGLVCSCSGWNKLFDQPSQVDSVQH